MLRLNSAGGVRWQTRVPWGASPLAEGESLGYSAALAVTGSYVVSQSDEEQPRVFAMAVDTGAPQWIRTVTYPLISIMSTGRDNLVMHDDGRLAGLDPGGDVVLHTADQELFCD